MKLLLQFLLFTFFSAFGENNMTTYLKDYKKSDFKVNSIFLTIDLYEDNTLITNEMEISRVENSKSPLVLDGKNQELVEVRVNGKKLASQDYQLTPKTLTIQNIGNDAKLTIISKIKPQDNTELQGLYKSGDNLYLSQCESQGFRNITYFLDRPDIMTIYKTKIIADKKFPILLSNGDMIEKGELAGNRHYATWYDPSKKPSYLFAAVIGDLSVLEDEFITASGRKIDLKIYIPQKDLNKSTFAMESLKAAMRWDEKNFGREYDLNTYMIVSTPMFNYGAMENKGLNIFNNRFILASKDIATDMNYIDVSGVIAHEYFHNWTGNRVTLRDWFQLSLKEGLTVFRDQEFTADEFSRPIKRIEDVELLRAEQFKEDSGALSHPVRPESYVEINNFYTTTIYEKGAEVIRMIKTIIGAENFRKGMDLYFARHDGNAVTTDDFVKAMEDAAKVDLTQFKLWYSQAGTPNVDIKGHYNSDKKTFTLKMTQTFADDDIHRNNKPQVIPIKLGLVGNSSRKNLTFEYDGQPSKEVVLLLNKEEQVFEFKNIEEEPIPSLFRDFSAPVKYHYPYTNEQLLLLFLHDENEFNRWDAGQRYYNNFITKVVNEGGEVSKYNEVSEIADVFVKLIADKKLDKAFVEAAITIPSTTELEQNFKTFDPTKIYSVREDLIRSVSSKIKSNLLSCYEGLNKELGEYQLTKEDIAKRNLKNTCLKYLAKADQKQGDNLASDQFLSADNITDRVAALLVIKDTQEKKLFDLAFNNLYEKWQNEDLVILKWISLQALSGRSDINEIVQAILNNKIFDIKSPNMIRSLLGGLINNINFFHKEDGSGYEFIADWVIKLDSINTTVASGLAKKFQNCRKLTPKLQEKMLKALERIKNYKNISDDVREIIEKI